MSDDEDFAPHFVYGPSHYTVISEPNYRETLSSSFEFLDFSKVASSKKRRPNVQATSPADGTTTSKNKSNAKRFKQAILCLSEDIQLSLALSLSMMPSVDDGPKKSRRFLVDLPILRLNLIRYFTL